MSNTSRLAPSIDASALFRLCGAWAAVVAFVAFFASGASAAFATGAAPEDENTTASAVENPVVFVGVPGLAWSDVDADATPSLWQAVQGSTGSLIVRSVWTTTCPADGWLALNTGARAAVDGDCDVLVDPIEGQVHMWKEVREAVDGQNYSARLGRFAENLSAVEVSALGIGPGAALALADPSGRVEGYEQRAEAGKGLAEQVARAAEENHFVVVDAGEIQAVPRNTHSTAEQFRRDQIRILDNRVEEILRGIAESAAEPVIVFAGIGDDGAPSLRVLSISGPQMPGGELTSPSTRQPGYSLATDLHATVLDQLGVLSEENPKALRVPGTAIQSLPSDKSASDLHQRALEREQQASALLPPVVPTFFLVMVVLNLGLYAVVAVGLKRPTITRLHLWWQRHRSTPAPESEGTRVPPRVPVLKVLRTAALAVGALPVASYVANVVPWWRFSAPGFALGAVIVVVDLLIVALALAGPWRRYPLGPAGIVAGLMALILAGDALTGSTLQLISVMGNPPLVAGRFYGMNNTAFAQFSASMLLLAAIAAQPLFQRRRRWAAAILVTGFGIVAAFLDGAPSIGADFGGPPAILPAFLIMALMVAGVRLTWQRVTAVFLGTFIIVTLIAFLDWLRPIDERSHIGDFFDSVLDGELLTVILRKLDANLKVLARNRPLTLLALGAIALVIFVLARPIRSEITDPAGGRFGWLSGGIPLIAMSRQTPLITPAVVGAGILAGLGMALNDSGIAIPANVAAVFLPLLLSALATWMLTLNIPPEHEREPERSIEGAKAPPEE